MRLPLPALLAAAGPLFAAAPALALTALTGTAFGAGLAEPSYVLQHLLGLLAIGLWAGQTGGVAVWQVPAAALTALAAAGLAARYGVRLPYAGLGLEASLVVMGGLVALGLRVPTVVAVLVAALAAVFHGYAQEGAWAFLGGFLAGAALVVCAGLGLAGVLAQGVSPRAVRMCGGGVALAGLLDLLGTF